MMILKFLITTCFLVSVNLANTGYGYNYGCPAPNVCLPAVYCAASYTGTVEYAIESCVLPSQSVHYAGVQHESQPGLCCEPIAQTEKSEFKPLRHIPSVTTALRLDAYSLNHAAKVGLQEVAWIQEFEGVLSSRGINVKRNSSSYGHLLFFKTTPKAIEASRKAMVSVVASQDLGTRFQLSKAEAGLGLNEYSIADTVIADNCPKNPKCLKSDLKYRSLDGTCNNAANSLWGSSNTPFNRILTPSYSDGVWRPRTSDTDGKNLPSARLVSLNVVPNFNNPSQINTLNVMQWGQFVDHDLTHTPIFKLQRPKEMNGGGEDGITCCTEDGSMPISLLVNHPECFPIEIPENDPFYSQFKQRCMNFVRSMPSPNLDCNFGYGEQMNQITHFLDASNVYGSSQDEAKLLRSYHGGLLNVTHDHYRELLPTDDDKGQCQIPKPIDKVHDCFKAGDSRANEQPGLTAFHTVWMRQHNSVARGLSYLNPHWNDERIYQETRKIVTAQIQHITYNEWLPIILGKDYMKKHNLLSVTSGYSYTYDQIINPSITNEFATAAFRFGHSLVDGAFKLSKTDADYSTAVEEIKLRNLFFNPNLIYKPGKLDQFLISLSLVGQQTFDNLVVDDLTNHLFQQQNSKFGMDLVALNIQRGRDHGLPGYNEYREMCGLKKAKSFDDLQDVFHKIIIERLQMIYSSVDDIDLFIAGISEAPIPGALLGPTFLCIVGDQFQRLKSGDSHWYENEHIFNPYQLAEIKKTSLARITCDNGDGISVHQPLAFKLTSYVNQNVYCDSISIPKVDLYPWKDYYQ